MKRTQLLIATSLLTSGAVLADNRIDYDIDNDGLIEIFTLEDLDQIRHEADPQSGLITGATLYGNNDGCAPGDDNQPQCHGYELAADLSFDSNNNGEFDPGDSFWNDGKGFAPFGQFSPKFGAEFHGNGFAIKHLYMNYPEQRFVGLFSYNEMAYIHDLTLSAEIIGGMHSGALIGHGWQTRIKNIRANVTVRSGADQIGGLIGILEDGSRVSNVALEAELFSNYRTGGLIGQAAASEFSDIAVTAHFHNYSDLNDKPGWRWMGGVAGWSDDSQYQSIIANSHFDVSASIGGILGTANLDSLSDVLVVGQVTSARSAAGMVGNDYSESGTRGVTISRGISLLHIPDTVAAGGVVSSDSHYKSAAMASVFWASDLSNTTQRIANNPNAGSNDVRASDIYCASETNNCNGLIFTGFDQPTNHEGQRLWHFNNNSQTPQLLLMGKRYPTLDPDSDPDPKPDPDKGDNNNSGGAWWLWLLPIGVLARYRQA
ncbi:hypothetical protein [Bacterioplanoides pacificum]|uniref:Uncharacterized protein n=1 Tax=Bacterioplanoides pacificum TaxID=1171596 RepID=A0ABV7VUV6_9GAMM